MCLWCVRCLRYDWKHMTRHTYATTLCEAGTPIYDMAKLLGDTVATVENTYAHVLRVRTEAASVVDVLLPGLDRSLISADLDR
jgi:integrase